MRRRTSVRFLLFFAAALTTFGAEVSLGGVAREKWIKVTLGEMTVMTDASEGKLREWAAEMAWVQDGLRSALPIPGGGAGEPATIFLFNSDRDMRRFLPDYGKKPMLLGGFFSSVAGQNVGMIGLGGSRFDVRAKLFHEMTHWHLERSGADVPLWLHEGLAQVFELFTLQGNGFRIGHNQPEMLHVVKIAGTPALEPLLVKTSLDYSRDGWRHGQTSLFYAQSWALIHMLLFGTDGGNYGRFSQYLGELRRGSGGSEAFARGFGLTPEAARRKLDVYVRVPRWNFATFPLGRTITRESFRVETVGPGELYRQFGMLLLAAGRHDEAEQFINYAGATEAGDPRNAVLAGMLAISRKPPDRSAGEEAFERARRLSSQNPWVYVLLGRARLEGMGPGDNPDAVAFNEDRLREAGELFIAATNLRSGFKPAIEALAGIVLTSENPRPEFREVVKTAADGGARSPLVQLAVADEELRARRSGAALRLEQLLARESELSVELVARARDMLTKARAAAPD